MTIDFVDRILTQLAEQFRPHGFICVDPIEEPPRRPSPPAPAPSEGS